MKRISFLQVSLFAFLAIVAVSCSTPMGASGDYYEEAPVRRNSYYNDSYYGSPNTIIVERDPFTGQYYQVQPRVYGNVYGAPAYPYSHRYNRNYNNGNYNSGRNNTYRRTIPQTSQPQQTPAQRQQTQQQRDQAKESILGKKRN